MSRGLSGNRSATRRSRWRLIRDEPRDGATNMAIDEVLASGCAQGCGFPSLRLYRWSVPTVSFGCNQRIQGQVDLTNCAQLGIPVVRRPTGGRALLHHHELTYSVACPIPAGNRGVLQDYQWISTCLLLALRKLGVAAALSRGDRTGDEAGGVCFNSSSRYELTVNGRKLIGSAQRRFKHTLLQQGSLLMDIDHAAWNALFPGARTLAVRATALRLELGRPVSWKEVSEAIRAGFEEGVGVQLDADEITPQEMEAAQALVDTRYRSTDWTLCRSHSAFRGAPVEPLD